jgi:hypothetical protein
MVHDNSTTSYDEHKGSGKAEIFRIKIYNLIVASSRGITDRQLLEALDESDVNNVRPEITRLKQDGLIEEIGKVQCERTGKAVRISAPTGRPYFSRGRGRRGSTSCLDI